MPVAKIEVKEYTCLLCGYRWINRHDGKDGPTPKRCAKCKERAWDGSLTTTISNNRFKERGAEFEEGKRSLRVMRSQRIRLTNLT